MSKIVLAAVLSSMLLGCAAEIVPPAVRVKNPVSYDSGHRYKSHDHKYYDNRFCPPGQAKKGRC